MPRYDMLRETEVNKNQCFHVPTFLGLVSAQSRKTHTIRWLILDLYIAKEEVQSIGAINILAGTTLKGHNLTFHPFVILGRSVENLQQNF